MTEDRSKLAALKSDVQLQEHQQRIRDRIASGDNRLLLYHGLGSGKSLSSLAAAEAAGGPYTAVAPASLRQNYQKEVEKFTENSQPDILSYTGLGMGKRPGSDPNTVIFDEAHRLRNPNTAGAQGAAQLAQKAKNVLLLTGTPVTNSPGDLASLLGILHNKSIDPAKFERDFVGYKKVYPSLLSHLTGSGVGEESVLQNEDKLRSLFRGKIDYQASKTPEGVNVDEQTIRVPLSRDQKRIQSAIRSKIPMGWAWKLDQEFPLSRPELASLNSFMTGLRQSSLSTLPFRADKNPLTAFDESSKLQRAMSDLKSELGSNPNKKAIIYSNFINAGLSPYAAALKRDRIPYGLFHGGLPTAERQQNLKDYNEGKLRALLLGPAGAEGISTKGTNLIQLLDPHWHESRLNQARGRGLRFDSHQGLPEDLKNVAVRRYVSKSEDPSWLMRFLGSHRQRTGDEILETLAARKEKLNDQFRHVLQDEGTEKKQEADQLQKQAFLNAVLQGGKLAAKGIRSALSSYGSTLSGQAAGAARKALSDLDEPYQKALSTHLWGPRGMVPVKEWPPSWRDQGQAQERDELFAQFNKDVFLPAQKAFYDAENLTKKLDFNKNMARALTGAGIGAAGVGGAMAMNKESGALGRAAALMALYPTEKRAISPQLVTRALFSAVNKSRAGLITPRRFSNFLETTSRWRPKALSRVYKDLPTRIEGPSLQPAVLLESPTAPILPKSSFWPDDNPGIHPEIHRLQDSAKYVHLPEPIRQSYENAARHTGGAYTQPPVINNVATSQGPFYDPLLHILAGKDIWKAPNLFHELGHSVHLPATLNKGQLEGFAEKYRSSPFMTSGSRKLSSVFLENSQHPGTWARPATRSMTNEIMAWRRGSQMYREYLSQLPAEQRAGLLSVSEFLKTRKGPLTTYRHRDLRDIYIPAARNALEDADARHRRAMRQLPLPAEFYSVNAASRNPPPANFIQRARTFLQQLLPGATARRKDVYARHRQQKELLAAQYKKFVQATSATKTAAEKQAISPQLVTRSLFSAVNKARKGLITPARLDRFVEATSKWQPEAFERAGELLKTMQHGPSLQPTAMNMYGGAFRAQTAPVLPPQPGPVRDLTSWLGRDSLPTTQDLHNSAAYVHLPEAVRRSYADVARRVGGAHTQPPVINTSNLAAQEGVFYDTSRHVLAGNNIWHAPSLFHELGHAVDLPARLNKGQLAGLTGKVNKFRDASFLKNIDHWKDVFSESSLRPGAWTRPATRTVQTGHEIMAWRRGSQMYREYLSRLPAEQRAGALSVSEFLKARKVPLNTYRHGDLREIYLPSARNAVSDIKHETAAADKAELLRAFHQRYPEFKTAADITKLSPKWSDREHLLAALPKHLTDTQTAMSTPGGNVDKEMTDLALIARAWLKSQQQKELLAARLKKFQETAAYPSLALQTPSLTMAKGASIMLNNGNQRGFMPSQLSNNNYAATFPAGQKLPVNPNPLSRTKPVKTLNADEGGIQQAMAKLARHTGKKPKCDYQLNPTAAGEGLKKYTVDAAADAKGLDAFKSLDQYMKKAGLNSFQASFFGRLIRAGLSQSQIQTATKMAGDSFGTNVAMELNSGIEKMGFVSLIPKILPAAGRALAAVGRYAKPAAKAVANYADLGTLNPVKGIKGAIQSVRNAPRPDALKLLGDRATTGLATGLLNPYTGLPAGDSEGNVFSAENLGRTALSGIAGMGLGQLGGKGWQGLQRRALSGQGVGTSAGMIGDLIGIGDGNNADRLGRYGFIGGAAMPAKVPTRLGIGGFSMSTGKLGGKELATGLRQAGKGNLGVMDNFDLNNQAANYIGKGFSNVSKAFKANPHQFARTAAITGGAGLGGYSMMQVPGIINNQANLARQQLEGHLHQGRQDFVNQVDAALTPIQQAANSANGLFSNIPGMFNNAVNSVGDYYGKNKEWLNPLLQAGGGAGLGYMLGGGRGAALGGIGAPLAMALLQNPDAFKNLGFGKDQSESFQNEVSRNNEEQDRVIAQPGQAGYDPNAPIADPLARTENNSDVPENEIMRQSRLAHMA